MTHDALPLLSWQRPCSLIAFPAEKRTGHALKVAHQLAKARTNREADWALSRALRTFEDQMIAAGFPRAEIVCQTKAMVKAIHHHCEVINSKWLPSVEEIDPEGAA